MTIETRRGYRIQVEQGPAATTDALAKTKPMAGTALKQPPSQEVLLIDGAKLPYVKTPAGYSIYFIAPTATLLEAARAYIDTQVDKSK